MTLSTRVRHVALIVCALIVLGVVGCKSDGVQAAGGGSGADMSGPATMNAEYGARNARVCSKVTSAPSLAQATALVQCHAEGLMGGSLWLVTDLQVEMGSPRGATTMDTDINDLDASSKIYPLRGQATKWSCGLVSQYGAGTNCQKFPATPGQTGRCWHSNFGEWNCSMGAGGSNWVSHVPGPTTY